MQGAITCTLLGPDLTEAGLFRADFLVVTAADYPANTLQGVQRTRWSPDLVAATLDIGCALIPGRRGRVCPKPWPSRQGAP